MKKKAISTADIHVREADGKVVVALIGELTHHTVKGLYPKLERVFDMKKPLTVEMSNVPTMDSAGLALLMRGVQILGYGKSGVSFVGVRDKVKKTFELAGWGTTPAGKRDETTQIGISEAVGGSVSSAFDSVYYYLFLISETFYHGLINPFRSGKFRFGILFEQMSRLGAGSAPIVWLIALLVGLTTAYQAAYELRRFGANIYLADLVSISMMTELGPLMAAIIVAGRSGAAITAEIGTMQVNEEVDALRLIGINPIQYLVVPRVWAVMISQAFLGATSAIVGIFGGFVVAVVSLELSPRAFLNQTISALVLMDLVNNVGKSCIFGFIIVTVGAFFGLKVSGGAAGVGKATTNSVVMSIFMIIVADCVYSLI